MNPNDPEQPEEVEHPAIRQLRELRQVAAEVIDALCLRGMPLKESWNTLCLFTGRYIEPFLSGPHINKKLLEACEKALDVFEKAYEETPSEYAVKIKAILQDAIDVAKTK